MKALNFLPGDYHSIISRCGKRCTKKIFTAIIDRVAVKPVFFLCHEDITAAVANIITPAEMREYLAHKHETPVTDT
jgi:hypothetical protein